MDVEVVTREGCHLCSEVIEMIRRQGIEPRLLDVDSDPELFRLYDFRVPVLLVGGRIVSEGRLEHDALRRLLGA